MQHWKQRVLLALLLVVAGTIELRFAWTTLRYVASPRSFAMEPAQFDPVTMKLSNLQAFALRAGLKEGDVVTGVNGAPVHSLTEAGRAFYRSSPGSTITFRVTRGGAPLDVPFVIPPRGEDDWQTYVIPPVINIFTPLSCTLLAFLVAFRRPSDPVARALFGLLFGLSFMFHANGSFRYTYDAPFTWAAMFLDAFAGSLWAPMWLLFTLAFPDPKSPHKLLPRVAWALAVPYAICMLCFGAVAAMVVHGVPVHGLLKLGDYVPGWLFTAWSGAMVALGFVNLFYKLVKETEPIQRRRLRWVLFGLCMGLGPVTLLLLSTAVLHRDLNTYPAWALLPGLFSPLLVPLTLGYAVLVDRVFDIGVFVRQGLLASWTTLAGSVLLMALFSWETYRFVSRTDISNAQRAAGVAAALTGILVMTRALDWLRGWVDRRFFREAVNAERVLTELSTEVRRIGDPQLLLRTVSERIASALHIDSVVALLPQGGALVPAFSMGVAASGATGPLPLASAELEAIRENAGPVLVSSRQRERTPLDKLGAEVLLPLSTNGELHGVLSLGAKRSEEPYSGRDLRLLESVASQTALALEVSRLNATVAAEAEQRTRMRNEIEIARQVQERLFPKCAPDIEGLDLCGHCVPAETIGGDYYDFLITPTRALGLAIGDVAGKGVPAALLMAGLQASLRGLTAAGLTDLSELVAKLNQLVYDATPSNRFATFFYGLYDPGERRLRYATAGHNPALLWRASTGEALWLKTRGVGLGLRRSSEYEQGDVEMRSGDCLVLYTDGVTEARDVAGEEFGVERLAAIVRDHDGAPAPEILRSVQDAIAEFAGDAPQFDDITLIVARVN